MRFISAGLGLILAMAVAAYAGSVFAAPSPLATRAACFERLPADANYELLKNRIETCGLRTVESVIAILPESHLKNYTLMHTSASAQGSSYQNPRAILYGEDARLIVAFNGESSQAAYQDLELIQFRDDSKQFEFRRIRFPEGSSRGEAFVAFSEPNPKQCLHCHRAEPRPVWEPYLVWPGAYGGEDDSLFRGFINHLPAEESRLYHDFMASRAQHPRYRDLRESPVLPNALLGIALNRLNMESLARSLARHPKSASYRYALLGAATCSNVEGFEIPDFVPAALPVRASYAATLEDTRAKQLRAFNERIGVLKIISPSSPETPRVIEFAGRAAGGDLAGLDDADATAAVRWIAEDLMGASIKQFSLEFGSRYYTFADGLEGITTLRKPLVAELLKDEPGFQALFEPHVSDDPEGENTQYQIPVEDLCDQLKEKSLAALSALPAIPYYLARVEAGKETAGKTRPLNQID